MKDNDTQLIAEAYTQEVHLPLKKAAESEEYDQDDNDQYAPEEAAADDQLGQMEPLDGEDEEVDLTKIETALNNIADELKTLNSYADFMTTGTRGKGFTGGVVK
jgi:hypothetical protein